MSHKAIIRKRAGGEPAAISPAEAAALGVEVHHHLGAGTLVAVDDEKQLRDLERAGYRVKLLPDTNLLVIGDYRIDIEKSDPEVPRSLDVPPASVGSWPHHLVQLAAPPEPDWVARIEQLGIDVVEPVSAYGLFVVAAPGQLALLKQLPYVEWSGPFKPAYRISNSLEGRKGMLKYVGIMVYPASQAGSVEEVLTAGRGVVTGKVSAIPATYGGEFAVFRAEMDAKLIPVLARIPAVRWLDYQPPVSARGEREAQIIAENLDGVAPPNTAPVAGYQAWLATAGIDGSGVTIAIADVGVDAGAANNAIGHLDLRGRQAAFVPYPGAGATDSDGHGTHVAAIALGNAASGQNEGAAAGNFLWGQGVAPQASYVTQNFVSAAPQPLLSDVIRDSSSYSAQVMNNSWGDEDSVGVGYHALSRVIDLAVRDANPATPLPAPLVIVCAAGNSGGATETIEAPHESKNDIVVGNSLTSRPAARFPRRDIRGIFGTSSRGPAKDGRIFPVVVAPGTDVSAALSRASTRATIPGTGTPDPGNAGHTIDGYFYMSGTSQACANVSGTCALLIEWWRQRTGGRNPSPALLKALLVNGAEDLAGGENWRCLSRSPADRAAWSHQGSNVYRRDMAFVPVEVIHDTTVLVQRAAPANITGPGEWAFDAANNRLSVRIVPVAGESNPGAVRPALHARDAVDIGHVPNGHQGWGRVSLANMVQQAPASDRGPKIFLDQRNAFTASGQEFMIRVAPADAARWLRITLTYTDAAGAATGSGSALVNDLNLEVTHVSTGDVFKGNHFGGGNGFSSTGGNFNKADNVECVYLPGPTGTYEVRVIAFSVLASAHPDISTPWQDFALVIDNAVVPSAAAPVAVVPVIDRSGSMVSYGYDAVTLTASRQFVDLLSVDDRLGVVSFGNAAAIEYPAGAAPALQTISGPPDLVTANDAIDAIAFGGCTYMGDGILRARDLLAGITGPRAMVLLSDGYDNKGCQPGNAARPSAADAVALLPAGLPVYTCAMGPASDQNLLAQIAASSGGRYFYMPTIDDLFQIYNYIRGQVSGDAVVANESAMASASRVGAFVDSGAAQCRFSIAWGDPKIRYTSERPRRAAYITVRLRDPRGQLLPPHDTYFRRTVGDGYVIFEIQEPMPGQWHVEVETGAEKHLRYTVGAFVTSPLRLQLTAQPGAVSGGFPLKVDARVLVADAPVGGIRGSAVISAPGMSLGNLAVKYRNKLRTINAVTPKGDAIPANIGKLLALRRAILKSNGEDIFATIDTRILLKDPGTGIVTAQMAGTQQQGSYNVAVTVQGNSPTTGSRFVRKDMVSVLVN